MDDDDVLLTALAAALIVGLIVGMFLGSFLAARQVAKIGSDKVTSLNCEEDETIGYDPRIEYGPRPLACIPYSVLEER